MTAKSHFSRVRSSSRKDDRSANRNSGVFSRHFRLFVFAAMMLMGAQLTEAQWSSGSGNTTTTDKVGIGTTSPGEKLHVQDGNIQISDGSGNSGATVSFLGSQAGTGRNFQIGNQIQATDSFTITPSTATGGSTFTTPAFTILGASGNVGIGTASPGYKLDVSGNANVQGNITASGSIAAKYQDVAEWVPSSEQLSAGTVVVLDSTKSNQVTSSSVSYDTRVAGVVSERPGIALGEKSESKSLIATTGRVKVKVDATGSPIHIGDLLVTSDIAGVAMKSEPVNLGGVQLHRPGTLIGKALEPLEKGKGEILVLLSLQ